MTLIVNCSFVSGVEIELPSPLSQSEKCFPEIVMAILVVCVASFLLRFFFINIWNPWK